MLPLLISSMIRMFKTVEQIDPDVIIPVHTTEPQWFKENFDDTSLLERGKSLEF